MRTESRVYRVVLAGAFPKVIPKECDVRKDNVRAAAAWALARCIASNGRGMPIPGFSRFKIYEMNNGRRDDHPVYEWSAGE